jgi:hypothetical protein
MNKWLFVFLIVIMAFMPLVTSVTYDFYNYAELAYVSVNYEPMPISPGSQFDIWFNFENSGSQPTQNATFNLVAAYPFYFDASETSQKVFGHLDSNYKLIVPYRVRVKEDAGDGYYNITIQYSVNGVVYREKEITVKVAKVDTDFDVAVQSYSLGELSLAISNIGKNNANAVTVQTTGVQKSKSIVGNLEAGDYTVVFIPLSSDRGGNSEMVVEISYTDLNGNRRKSTKRVTIDAALEVAPSSASGFATAGLSPRRDNSFNPWFYSTLALLALIVGYFVYSKVRKRGEEL